MNLTPNDTEREHPSTEARCPGCGHSCCPRKDLECGGDSDVVAACRTSGCFTKGDRHG